MKLMIAVLSLFLFLSCTQTGSGSLGLDEGGEHNPTPSPGPDPTPTPDPDPTPNPGSSSCFLESVMCSESATMIANCTGGTVVDTACETTDVVDTCETEVGTIYLLTDALSCDNLQIE